MSVSANNKFDTSMQPGSVAVAGAPPRIILLVEEQAHVERVIRHNLERCGFRLESVQNAHRAQQLMMERTFDALIVTGEQTGPEIQEMCAQGSDRLAVHDRHDGKPALPMMLVSCSESDDLSASLAGFERLSQPVSLKHIVERLRQALDSGTSESAF